MALLETTRIDHIDRIRTAYIMWRDFPVATISEEYSSITHESDWVIRPIWENCERAMREFGHRIDIAGIDLSKHQDEYIRRYVPGFVEQRTVPRGRPDCRAWLDMLHMPGYDLFEMMCRSHASTGNDNYYVSRTPDIVIDVHDPKYPLDIPDFDTSRYGWLRQGDTEV